MPPASYPIPTYSGTNAPSPAAIANRQLTYSVGPSSSQPAPAGTAGTDVGGNEQAASALQAYLNGGTLSPNESSLENTIMGTYNQAKQNTSSAYQGEAQAITNDYQNQADQLNRELGNQMKGELESRSGFATNNAMLRNLQETGQNRIDQLTKQRDEALLNNNMDMANSLNNLIVNEQNLITTSRQNMVENLKAGATLQTPEQQVMLEQQKAQQDAVVQLMTEAPDAGITPSDDFATATSKFRNSQYYKNNIGQGEATINNLQAQAKAAGASAALSGAQAALTNRQLSLIGGGSNGSGTPSNSDQNFIDALKAGKLTPQQLQAQLGTEGDIGGYQYNNIMNEAAKQGYDINQGTLTGIAQEGQTNALNSGNPFYMLGGWLSQGANAVGRTLSSFGGNSGTTVTYNGKTYSFPTAAAASTFKSKLGIQ